MAVCDDDLWMLSVTLVTVWITSRAVGVFDAAGYAAVPNVCLHALHTYLVRKATGPQNPVLFGGVHRHGFHIRSIVERARCKVFHRYAGVLNSLSEEFVKWL